MALERRPFNVAVIGAGVGRTHIAALASMAEARPALICDIDQGRAEALADEFDVPGITTDAEDVFAMPDIDAVSLATPHHLHAPHAIAAAAAGKHVIVEKPLCNTLDEADRMIAACRQAGVGLGVIFQSRFAKEAQTLRHLIDEGRLGRIFLAQATIKWERSGAYYTGAPWRAKRETAGGGVLAIQAVHSLDLLQWLAGPVESVTARVNTFTHDIKVEDTAVCLLRLSNGGLGNVVASVSVHPETPALLELHGEKGSVAIAEYRGGIGYSVCLRDDPKPGFPMTRATVRLQDIEAQDSSKPHLATPDLHRNAFAEFFGCIADEKPLPLDGREGRKSVALLDAIYRSADEGREVVLDTGL